MRNIAEFMNKIWQIVIVEIKQTLIYLLHNLRLMTEIEQNLNSTGLLDFCP